MPVYSFISGRSTIWQQFALWQEEWITDLIEPCWMKDVPACKRDGLQRASAHLCAHLSWYISMCIVSSVYEIAVSRWAGFLPETWWRRTVLLSILPPASLRGIRGVSSLLISRDFYLFRCSWGLPASLPTVVAILEIFSAFYFSVATVGTCSMKTHHWNRPKVPKEGVISGWLLLPIILSGCGQQPCVLPKSCLMLCPTPLCVWGPTLHLIAVVTVVCGYGASLGILSLRMKRSHPFESGHHFLSIAQ